MYSLGQHGLCSVCRCLTEHFEDLTKCALAPWMKTYCAPYFSAAFFLELLFLQDLRLRGSGCLARVMTSKEVLSAEKYHAASQRRVQSLWGTVLKDLLVTNG